jgi:hypothetical protein
MMLVSSGTTPRQSKPGTDSEGKHEPASDFDTAAVDSLKALDPNEPIREADITAAALRIRIARRATTAGAAMIWEWVPHQTTITGLFLETRCASDSACRHLQQPRPMRGCLGQHGRRNDRGERAERDRSSLAKHW